MATNPPVVDPWLEPFQSLGSENYFQDITKIAKDEGFGTPDNPPDQPIPVADLIPPVEPVVAPEPDEAQPKVFEIDGGKVTMEKTKKGWTGVLETATGAKPEVFYGATKDELLVNVLKGKLHATKTIQELNRKVKLGDGVPTRETPARTSPTRIKSRDLTADERFEYKTLLDSDPVAAQDFLNEKRYGLTPEEYVARLNKTVDIEEQTRSAEIDRISNQFIKENDDYFPTAENYSTILKYLSHEHLGRVPTKRDLEESMKSGAIPQSLYDAGAWTIQDLEAAKEDLLESGLLLGKPVAPTPVPPVAVIPQPEPQPPVLAPVVPAVIPAPAVRTRSATLGLRESEASPLPASTPTATSVEDFDNLSPEDLERVMHSVRQSRLRGR